MASQAGFWVSNVSLQLLIVRMSGGNGLAQGLLAFFNFVPILLLSTFAGVLADRLERRTILVASQTALGIVAALLAAATWTGIASIPVLYGLAFCLGVALAVGQPVSQALVANSVPRGDLGSAVSLQSVGLNLSRAAGPALAVPLVLYAGPQAAFAVYSLAAFGSAVVIGATQFAPQEFQIQEGGILAQIRHGYDHAGSRPPALAALAMVAVGGVFASSFSILVPTYAVGVLHKEAIGFFPITVAIGIGAAVGALTTGFSLTRARIAYSSFQMLALGVVISLIGLNRSYAFALVLAGLYGALLFAFMTTLNSTLQYLVEDGSRGRVMGLFTLAWGGLVPIGGLLLGSLSALIGPGNAIFCFGCVILTYAIFVGLRHRHEVILVGMLMP